jgi:hypothetical protein
MHLKEEGAQSLGQVLEVRLVHRRIELHDRQILVAEGVATGDVYFLA